MVPSDFLLLATSEEIDDGVIHRDFLSRFMEPGLDPFDLSVACGIRTLRKGTHDLHRFLVKHLSFESFCCNRSFPRLFKFDALSECPIGDKLLLLG